MINPRARRGRFVELGSLDGVLVLKDSCGRESRVRRTGAALRSSLSDVGVFCFQSSSSLGQQAHPQ